MRVVAATSLILSLFLALQLLYATLTVRTVDRLHRSELVLWAHDLQRQNPGALVPPVPWLSVDEIERHAACPSRGDRAEVQCYMRPQ